MYKESRQADQKSKVIPSYVYRSYLLSRNAERLPSAASLCYLGAHYTLSALKNVRLASGLEAGYHTALVDFKLMTSCLSLPKAMMMRMFPPYPALCSTPPPPHLTPAFFEIGFHSIAQVGLEPTVTSGRACEPPGLSLSRARIIDLHRYPSPLNNLDFWAAYISLC